MLDEILTYPFTPYYMRLQPPAFNDVDWIKRAVDTFRFVSDNIHVDNEYFRSAN